MLKDIKIKNLYQFMVMALLPWRSVVTHGGFSLQKSEESAKAGLIQVRVIQPEKYTMFFNFTWPGVVVLTSKWNA